jgi:predicted amidophosphoribosyltransferase
MCAVLEALSILGRETARIVLHASCVVCDRELPWRDRKASCCGACWSALPKITGAKCDSCAMPWSAGGAGFRCIACLDDPLPVGWTEAWGHYRGSLERLLHAFKFERHDFLDTPLAELLASVVRDADFDAIVPVPMHRSKLRQRGYNQAVLQKRVERSAQSTLACSDRAANVRGVFAASPRVRERSILIVDDVCTTAETLRACAHALLSGNASRVCAVIVAKA